MKKHRWPRRVVALLLLVSLSACYSYMPLDSAPPRAGDDVRVHLEEEARAASAPERARSVTGLVLRTRGDSLTLSMRETAGRYAGVGSAAYRDTLTLAGSEIRQIERNELDALRTTVLAGLGAGAVATAVILVINASPSGSGGGVGGETPRASVEIPIRIPLGIP